MIDKKHYTNKESFDFEINKIFKKKWLFACLINEVQNHNDFITLDFDTISIAIHNFNGELIAFQNVCSHRLKRIHIEKSGNRPFFCMYHGWNYNKNGLPSIPKKSSFEIDDIECLKLKRYNLEICGIFVFVNLNIDEPTNLLTYLGIFYNDLIDLSKYLGEKGRHGNISHTSNWKLLVENVLEGYHCPLVHKNSLVNLGYCIDYPKDIKYHDNHSSWHSPRLNQNTTKSKKFDFLNNLTFQHNSFYHIYIFPNLFISSTSGGFFYIGKVSPVKADISDLNFSFYSPRYNRELTDREKLLDKALFSLNCDSALEVLYEDKPMVESCQSGLQEECVQTGILSLTEEIRIIQFHNNLKKEYDK
jgi:phenylpropionate dioxygenase-like ring-hydroxylating dioxygenase large terminal subunit